VKIGISVTPVFANVLFAFFMFSACELLLDRRTDRRTRPVLGRRGTVSCRV